MVRAAALKAYGRMVHECKDKTISFASLMAGKLLQAPMTHVLASQCYHVEVFPPVLTIRLFHMFINWLLLYSCPCHHTWWKKLKHLTLYTSSDMTFQCQTLFVIVAGIISRDDAGRYCNTPAFWACLIAYFKWHKKSKAHFTMDQTSFSLKQLALVSTEVMCSTLAEISSSC